MSKDKLIFNVLVVDDEADWRNAITLVLEQVISIGEVVACEDPHEALKLIDEKRINLVILDLIMEVPGETILTQICRVHPGIPVIVLTALNQVETGVECMKLGAFDYLVKTVDEETMVASVQRALQVVELKHENQKLKHSLLKEDLEFPDIFRGIITKSPKILKIFRYIEAIASSTQPVLITGESGVGKELIAKAVHWSFGRSGQFVPVNVAGLDDHMFSDTLFGHTAGAFTGAIQSRAGMIQQATGGTLFLDEIGDLSIASQVKLLRLLQEREYNPLGSDLCKRSDVRIIVATNRNLLELKREDRFRSDLYFRLNAHRVHIPPLRERDEDIAVLLSHFLKLASKEMGKKRPFLPPELYVLLSTYHFPGNVRELKAMAYDAMATFKQGKLSLSSFRQAIGLETSEGMVNSEMVHFPNEDKVSFPDPLPSLKRVSDLLIMEALSRSQGNQTIAAGMLKISQSALSRRIKKMAYSK